MKMSFLVDEKLLHICLLTAHPGSAITVGTFEDGQNAVETGTSFTSEIVRTSVEYECDGRPLRQCLVFKIPFLSIHYELAKGLGFYDRETYMYNAVLPRMRAMPHCTVVPLHFHTTKTQVLVLEDLNEVGHYMLNQAALDYEHCAITLRGVATFHAASVKLHLEDDTLLAPATDEGIFSAYVRHKSMLALYPVLRAVLRMEQTSAQTIANFVAYEERINAVDFGQLMGGQHRFNVLNHGDLKTNNIMFEKGNQGQPVGIKLLDYQTCCWNSPALDLIFFNMATMDYTVYESCGEELLDDYLAMLNKTLSQEGCADCAYTRQDYEADVEACKLFQVGYRGNVFDIDFKC